MSETRDSLTRRNVLKAAAAGTAGLAVGRLGSADTVLEPRAKAKTMIGVPFEARRTVRIGFIGVGGRGTGLLRDLLAVPNVEIVAVCDVVAARVTNAQRMCRDRNRREPVGYTAGPHDYENLCKRDDIDLIYIATPWDWHVPMAVCAMEHGHHAAVEVPAAVTMKECWQLVDTSEKTRRHCVMLENCCYGYNEMLALNMVRAGVLGTITHGEAAYIHNLRGLLCATAGEGLWRREPHKVRDGNLYPTHGLGPVANYMDVNRGDRFEYLVSFSSPEAGLSEFVKEKFPESDPKRKEKYVCGDMNTSVIRTALGRTIMLQHDVITPRPYSRHNLIQGTKGTFADYPARVFVDGQPNDEWQTIEPFKEKWESRLWKELGDIARANGGHGGMDYIMSYRLIQCVREGLVPDMDAYDAAAWSAPTPLSEDSVKRKGASMKFPDFTRGLWKQKRTNMG